LSPQLPGDWEFYHNGYDEGILLEDNMSYGHIYKCYIRITNPLPTIDIMRDHSIDRTVDILIESGIISGRRVKLISELSEKICPLADNSEFHDGIIKYRLSQLMFEDLLQHGYDGISYTLKMEQIGDPVWIIFDRRQVKFVHQNHL
jgi:hypothetical protein